MDVVIIGAGVSGLALGKALIEKFPQKSIAILDKESRTGMGMSSRNSEVIHSGIYYPPNSLKAKHCRRGQRLLYAYCEENKIAHKKCGKLVVATKPQEEAALEKILNNAKECGVSSLQVLNAREVQKKEKALKCTNALWAPESGIISAHDFMDHLEMKFVNQGGMLSFHSEVISLQKKSDVYEVEYRVQGERLEKIAARVVINAAGLYADKIAKMVGLPIEALGYEIQFCKGNYFKVHGARGKIAHLVYPLPDPNVSGLGIHITPDLEGELKLGPDIEWLDEPQEDYQVNLQRKQSFLESVSRYWPEVMNYTVEPDFVGIRCKRTRKGFSDFVIQEETENGFPGFFNILSIDSPGLTTALSIAQAIAEEIGSLN